jgi:RHS repeat-associated protein
LCSVQGLSRLPKTSYRESYDSNGNATSRNGLGITWASYNHPLIINNSGSGESVQFAYNQNHQRWSAIYTGSAGIETTFFIGDLLEKVNGVGSSDYRHYIYAGGTKVAIYSRTTAGVNTLRYVREDHEGSASAILNNDGTVYAKESFTAFGARRSACTWSGAPTQGQLMKINAVSRHGYTWQMALGWMGLNDMNGRIQDAVTGRFLSADPTIPNAGGTQAFNRYTYVGNNPLSFADPTGFQAVSPNCRDNCLSPGTSYNACLRSARCSAIISGGVSEAITPPSVGSVDGMTVNTGDGSDSSSSINDVQESVDSYMAALNSAVNAAFGGSADDGDSGSGSSGTGGGTSDLPEVVVTGSRSGSSATTISFPQTLMSGFSMLGLKAVQAVFGWVDCAGHRCTATQEVMAFASAPLLVLGGPEMEAAEGIGALTPEIASTFANGEYTATTLTADMTAYRYSGGVSGAYGRFLRTV